jgi:hypothetical protein
LNNRTLSRVSDRPKTDRWNNLEADNSINIILVGGVSLITDDKILVSHDPSSFAFLENFFEERRIMRRAAMKEDSKRL